MNIATRSNDILWGFSGINTFEWSVLHEMLAFWLGVEMGSAHYLIGSLHLYARHYERASRIISSRKEKTIYDFGFTPHKFQTPFVNLNDVLSSWFEIETQMRNATVDLEGEIRKINDNFLRNSLYMLNIYNQFLNGAEPEFIFHLIADLPVSDFRISAIEFFTRKFKSKDLTQFSDQEMYFFEYFWSPGEIS